MIRSSLRTVSAALITIFSFTLLATSQTKEPIGRIVYYLNLPLSLTTDSLSDRILKADPKIEKIQWSKTKSASDIYQ